MHAERLSDAGHAGTQTAQAQQAEGFAVQADTDRFLPSSSADSFRLGGQVPRRGEDQRPGQLGGGEES
jgi:hypothetical protein